MVSSRTSAPQARADPGPITTGVCGYAALGTPSRFNNRGLWLWIPAIAGMTPVLLRDLDHDPPLSLRPYHARQDRLPDGRNGQGHHLSRARRALEPGRAAVPIAGAEGRRPHRAADGEPPR